MNCDKQILCSCAILPWTLVNCKLDYMNFNFYCEINVNNIYKNECEKSLQEDNVYVWHSSCTKILLTQV